MGALEFNCFKCQSTLRFIDSVGYRSECESCHEDAHCCKNCRFYDSKVYNECRETSAEAVREKEKANYCDYFLPRLDINESDKRSDLLKAAEALFKKS